MLDFHRLLTRADVPTLEALIGPPAARLLHALDPELVTGTSLRQTITSLRSEFELLQDPEAWREIVDLLKEPEAKELAEHLGLTTDGPVWDTIKSAKLKSRRQRDGACAFFGVTPPDEPPDDSRPECAEVESAYSLFQHQRVACTKAVSILESGDRRVVLHMPTGSGKTRTAMHIIARHLVANEPTVVIWLAYSQELCEQAATEFERAWKSLGNRPVDVVRFWRSYNPDLDSCKDGLIVAGLAKAYSRTKDDLQFIARLADAVSLVIIDEAHQSVADTYSLVIDALQTKQASTALLGLTATPGRTWNDIDEDRRLAEFFSNQKVILEVEGYDNPVDYLVEEGYLAKPTFRNLHSTTGVDLSETDRAKLERDLEVPQQILRRLGDDEQRNLLVVSEVEKLADEHKRILVFAASVESARLLATALEAHGRVSANAVDGGTAPLERHRIINWFKAPDDSTRVLCNYGVLHTGFDAPRTSAVVIARPTASLVLYSQMVGRATRGEKAGGNKTAEVVTVVDTGLPGFRDLSEFFTNWEDAGWHQATI